MIFLVLVPLVFPKNTSFYIVHYKSDFVHGNFSVNEVGIYDTSGKFCSLSYM